MSESDFFQDGPVLRNTYLSDSLLQRVLRFHTCTELDAFSPQLMELGELAAGEMRACAAAAEAQPPRHIPFDAWGKRIDHIEVSAAWKKMETWAAQFGIVATGYERKQAELSRVFQMALLYLYHPSSALFSCPLAMTDGAARALEIYGDQPPLQEAFRHLISRDPLQFWTAGQWMTERTGGSDVGPSLSVAKPGSGVNSYQLFGTKWFTSATTSQMAMTLARIEGSPDLSLFYVRVHNDLGQFQNIRIHRLKEKLGTKALPTAELSLEGTPALLVGGEGQGVKKIASLFNVTRIYNAVCSVGSMTRGLQLTSDYAKKRVAFKRPLVEHPLHLETLAEIATEKALATLLVFKVSALWGKDDCKVASKDESILLRLLTTLAKLSTGKSAVRTASEVLESFGGAGYVEDTGLPVLLRDSQVFPIWEGTTNVLSMDVLRALKKESAWSVFVADIEQRLQKLDPQGATASVQRLRQDLQTLDSWLSAQIGNEELLAWNARKISLAMAQIYSRSLIFEFSASTKHPWDLEVARRADSPMVFSPRAPSERAGLELLFQSESP